MIGIIVPAHDEEARIEDCVQSLPVAASHPALTCEPVKVIEVLDACRDRTGVLARSLDALARFCGGRQRSSCGLIGRSVGA